MLLECESVKDNSVKYKCLSCNKEYPNKIDEELRKRVKNTFKFSNNDIKFILLLRKGVYLYEYMDGWEKFNEISLPEKEEFYSNINVEDVTDANYMHAKRVCKDFEIKKDLVNITICILKVIHYFWVMFLKTLEKCVKKFMI